MLRVCIFLLIQTLAVQAGSQNDKAAWDAFHATQAKIRQQGADALERERSRSRAHLCDDAGKGERGGAGIAACLVNQAKVTHEDYLAYVRSIGGLLRLTAPGDSLERKPKRLSFDAAEDSWQKYQQQVCRSMSTQWIDVQASIAYTDCQLRLTWNHMNELDSLYSDLWR